MGKKEPSLRPRSSRTAVVRYSIREFERVIAFDTKLKTALWPSKTIQTK